MSTSFDGSFIDHAKIATTKFNPERLPNKAVRRFIRFVVRFS